MSNVLTGPWTPGFPVLNSTLLSQMATARDFVTYPGSSVTAGHISLYSHVQGLVSHYGLACGQPDYQTMSGRVLEDAHSAFVAKFKPAAAQAFGARLGDILKAKGPNETFEKEDLLYVGLLPELVGLGLLTYADAKNFRREMVNLTRQRVLRIADGMRAVGHPYSLAAWAPRALIYLSAVAFVAGVLYQQGGSYIINPLIVGGGLAAVGEISVAFFSRVLSGMFQFGSIRTALDDHTRVIRDVEDKPLYEPTQDGAKGGST